MSRMSMKALCRVWITGVCAAFLAGCEVRQPAAATDGSVTGEIALIAGVVMDRETLKGIPGVEVEISSVGTATTTSGGMYQFPEIQALPPSPSITIQAKAAGYAPASLTVDLSDKQLQMPTLLLTRLSSAQNIGPTGGEVRGPGGVTVQVPAGALGRVTPMTITPLYQAARVGTRLSDTLEVLVGLYLGPEGVSFAKPVRLTMPFTASVPPDRRKALLMYDRVTRRWDGVGDAVVSDDALSATATIFTGGTYAIGQEHLVLAPPILATSLRVWELVLDPCAQGPTTLWTLPEIYATDVFSSFFNPYSEVNDLVADRLGREQTLPSQPMSVPEGQHKVVAVAFWDYYLRSAWVMVASTKVDSAGNTVPVSSIGAEATVFNRQLRYKLDLRHCDQGQGS